MLGPSFDIKRCLRLKHHRSDRLFCVIIEMCQFDGRRLLKQCIFLELRRDQRRALVFPFLRDVICYGSTFIQYESDIVLKN